MVVKKEPNFLEARFSGGPWDGRVFRVKNPPVETMRVGYPEWATYVYIGGGKYQVDD